MGDVFAKISSSEEGLGAMFYSYSTRGSEAMYKFIFQNAACFVKFWTDVQATLAVVRKNADVTRAEIFGKQGDIDLVRSSFKQTSFTAWTNLDGHFIFPAR